MSQALPPDYDDSPLQASVSEATARRINRWLLLSFVAIILLLAVVLALRLLDTAPEVSAERLNQEAQLGNADATVQVIEYGAYGCTTCRALHQRGVVAQLLAAYGDQIEFRFRNLPIRTSNDELAAAAAQCALDQSEDAFWRYHDHLYAMSFTAFSALDDAADFARAADAANLDAARLESCLDDELHQRTVEHWHDIARDANVTGTPTFFVNDQRVNSANGLEDAIREELGL